MSDKTFLSRWSHRKSAQQQQTSAEPLIIPPADSAEEQPETHLPRALPQDAQETKQVEQPLLTDEDMPAIESLEDDSDFSQFFSSGVSEELRNLALRKLFNLPQFNIVDGLNDYDEDFSKMPALSQEVVARMRSWLNDKQEQITSEVIESTDQLKQSVSPQKPELNRASPYSDIEDDELGDADLEG